MQERELAWTALLTQDLCKRLRVRQSKSIECAWHVASASLVCEGNCRDSATQSFPNVYAIPEDLGLSEVGLRRRSSNQGEAAD